MNELYLGALDLSPYLTLAELESPSRWSVTCWNVPEGGWTAFCNPTRVPLYLRYNRAGIKAMNYEGIAANTVYADFLFLDYAPYVEINCMFPTQAGRFGFHVRTRLYLALGVDEL